MTDRKWRIINSTMDKDFYNKIEKYEKLGYELLPESFNFGGYKGGYYALMKNKNME
jgi:hypothetical protein